MDIQKILYRHYLEINIPGIVFFFIYTTGQTWAVLRIYHLPIPGDQWATITLLLLLGYISSPSRATFAAMILFALYSLYFYFPSHKRVRAEQKIFRINSKKSGKDVEIKYS